METNKSDFLAGLCRYRERISLYEKREPEEMKKWIPERNGRLSDVQTSTSENRFGVLGAWAYIVHG